MSATLHIQLLGDFHLVYGDTQVAGVNTPRLQALLAYLTLHRAAPQPRQHLAFLFWPDSTESQARTNLRHLLHQLHRALPEAETFLQAGAQTLQWRPDGPFTMDVAGFEGALLEAANAADPAVARQSLEQAVALYRGDLLPSCYDDWLQPERERLHQAFNEGLERLIGLLEQQRDYRAAIGYARRMLRHDPLREATYRHLMHLYAMNGDRAAALRAYHACAKTLRRELDVEPDSATREAYERLLNQETQSAPEGIAPPLAAAASLVGRKREWAQLRSAWEQATAGRPGFALLVGEAGIGKTRLTEELITWAGRQGITTAGARCYAAEGRLTYAPALDWLRSGAFQAPLRALDEAWLAEVARLLPELLGERPGMARTAPLPEASQRQRLFESLARAVLAARQPLLLVIDDIQWCDRDTLEWLHYLLRFDPRARLLVVGTLRPEGAATDPALASFRLQLSYSDVLTEIEVARLGEDDTAALAASMTGRALDPPLAARLYAETEGNPLFIVESVRMGLRVKGERSGEAAPSEIPLRP